jgi:hypothetical protein
MADRKGFLYPAVCQRRPAPSRRVSVISELRATDLALAN